MKVLSTINPHQKKSLLILFTAGLIFWAGMTSLLPTLPLYVESLGGTKQQIGLVMGAFALGLLPSRAWLGPLADRRGRLIVIRIGLSVGAIAPFGYLLIDSIPLLMLIRAFHGISIAAFTTGYSALVTDLSPPRNRGEIMGYMSLVTPIGLAIGPAIGGFLQEMAGYLPLFVMAASLAMLALLCTIQIQEEKPSRDRLPNQPLTQTPQPSQRFWQLLWNPRLRIPTLVMLLIGLGFGTLSTFVALFIKETGVDLNAGLFYTAAAIASFSLRIFIGRASDRYGRGLFITGALAIYVLSMLILWTANSPATFLTAAFLEGAASGTLIPMIIVLISDRCELQERGRFFALCVGGFDLGIAIAGPVLGAIAEQVGYRNMFAISAAVASLAFVLFVTQASKDVSHSLRFALGRTTDFYALTNQAHAKQV